MITQDLNIRFNAPLPNCCPTPVVLTVQFLFPNDPPGAFAGSSGAYDPQTNSIPITLVYDEEALGAGTFVVPIIVSGCGDSVTSSIVIVINPEDVCSSVVIVPSLTLDTAPYPNGGWQQGQLIAHVTLTLSPDPVPSCCGTPTVNISGANYVPPNLYAGYVTTTNIVVSTVGTATQIDFDIVVNNPIQLNADLLSGPIEISFNPEIHYNDPNQSCIIGPPISVVLITLDVPPPLPPPCILEYTATPIYTN